MMLYAVFLMVFAGGLVAADTENKAGGGESHLSYTTAPILNPTDTQADIHAIIADLEKGIVLLDRIADIKDNLTVVDTEAAMVCTNCFNLIKCGNIIEVALVERLAAVYHVFHDKLISVLSYAKNTHDEVKPPCQDSADEDTERLCT